VEDAYERILSRVAAEQKGNVKRILQIVVGARRALTIQEMAIALGIATSTQPKSLDEVQLDPIRLETHIRQWCGLFVFIDHSRIYLIHQTAKEFLICNCGSTAIESGWKHCLDPRGIERDMTRICVELLCFEDCGLKAQGLIQKFKKNQRIEDILDKENHVESLLVYSAEYWPDHLRDAPMPTNDSFTTKFFPFYDVDSVLYNLWFTIFWKVTRPHEDWPQMNSVRLAALSTDA
jgi:hypothetical protein